MKKLTGLLLNRLFVLGGSFLILLSPLLWYHSGIYRLVSMLFAWFVIDANLENEHISSWAAKFWRVFAILLGVPGLLLFYLWLAHKRHPSRALRFAFAYTGMLILGVSANLYFMYQVDRVWQLEDKIAATTAEGQPSLAKSSELGAQIANQYTYAADYALVDSLKEVVGYQDKIYQSIVELRDRTLIRFIPRYSVHFENVARQHKAIADVNRATIEYYETQRSKADRSVLATIDQRIAAENTTASSLDSVINSFIFPSFFSKELFRSLPVGTLIIVSLTVVDLMVIVAGITLAVMLFRMDRRSLKNWGGILIMDPRIRTQKAV